MSLRFDFERIKDYETTCYVDADELDADGTPLRRLNPVTNSLVWSTISVKLGAITEANADEFYARYKFCERLDGPFLTGAGGKPYRLTPEDVQAHIGLTCNVVNESRAKFLSGFKIDLDRDARAFRIATREAVAA